MNKKTVFAVIILFSVLFTAAVLYASPAISSQHLNMEKNGKKVNCAYCHSNPVFKIEQEKGQLGKDSLNGVPFSKIKTCAGSGCH
jgi:hypothetical protein